MIITKQRTKKLLRKPQYWNRPRGWSCDCVVQIQSVWVVWGPAHLRNHAFLLFLSLSLSLSLLVGVVGHRSKQSSWLMSPDEDYYSWRQSVCFDGKWTGNHKKIPAKKKYLAIKFGQTVELPENPRCFVGGQTICTVPALRQFTHPKFALYGPVKKVFSAYLFFDVIYNLC